MNQDEILAAKAAALATAKSELETAAGFRAPLAPGLRPPQLRRTESTGPSSLLGGPAQTPAQGSAPLGQATWPSPAAPTDGPLAADCYPGGQPAYTQSRPPIANPADIFAPQPAGASTHPTGVSGGLVPTSAGSTPLFNRSLGQRRDAFSRRSAVLRLLRHAAAAAAAAAAQGTLRAEQKL